ncbi:FmhC protein [Clostridium perfringens]|nr:FmhC protein [Clostridium perfringens]
MIFIKFNSSSELVDYLNKKDCYEPFILKEIEKYIIQNNNIFAENENIEPTKLVNLNIKVRSFSFEVTSMNIRKGKLKYYYWLYEKLKEQLLLLLYYVN